MKTARKGFTLIELMVVIVIIGILAAIAIPKLFGMTAKAKAQEVGGAAGTWSKLQSAFYMENSSFGSWQKISYRAPGMASTNATTASTPFFYYKDLSAPTLASWQATNTSALGDCVSGGVWSVTASISDGMDAVSATVTGSGEKCNDLTPNFHKLK